MVRNGAFLALIIALACLTAAGVTASVQGGPTTSVASGVVANPSRTYGGFWAVTEEYSSTLVLRNQEFAGAMSANIVLFSHDSGRQYTAQVQVPAHSMVQVNLATIANQDWGGLMVEMAHPTRSVVGKVIVSRISGGSVELNLRGGYSDDDENTLYAPWWLPEEVATDGNVILFNSSPQAVSVVPSVSAQGTEQAGDRIVLGPYETRELNLRHLVPEKSATLGNLILHYAGPPHALQPTLLIAQSKTGFFLAPSFSAKHHNSSSAQTNVWRFPNVAQSPLVTSPGSDLDPGFRAYALISNGTSHNLSTQFTSDVAQPDGDPEQALPGVVLEPLEARLVDLSTLIAIGAGRDGSTHFAISALYNGALGDLAMTVFSFDPTENIVSRSYGVRLPYGAVQSHTWSLNDHANLWPEIKLVNDSAGPARAALLYESSFALEPYVLSAIDNGATSSLTLNLRQLVHSGLPDEYGIRIPGDTQTGVLAVYGAQEGLAMSALNSECHEECAYDASAYGRSASVASVSSVELKVVPPPCGGGGGGTCYVPANFTKTSCTDAGSGDLRMVYTWGVSSGGTVDDLKACTMGEIVTYPGSANPYRFPSPPFPPDAYRNPTIGDLDASKETFTDNHFLTPSTTFVKPYSASSFTATQYYRYKCTCSGSSYVNVQGPNSIVRSVIKNSNGTWKFTVTKSGCSAQINPLP